MTLSLPVFSQTVSGSVVGYDPLFWKRELRLSNEQCLQLRDINAEFYKSLGTIANDPVKQALERAEIIQLLNTRSEKILGVFSDRQRKKWDRIADAYQGNIMASRTSLQRSSWTRN